MIISRPFTLGTLYKTINICGILQHNTSLYINLFLVTITYMKCYIKFQTP